MTRINADKMMKQIQKTLAPNESVQVRTVKAFGKRNEIYTITKNLICLVDKNADRNQYGTLIKEYVKRCK